MKKINKNTGITLVALVVTIVILLILAGITIWQLTGNGLFEKAKLAKEKQENAQAEEDETLGDYENAISSTVAGSRDTVTISKEEYQELKDAITPKNIDFQLTITPTTLSRKIAYAIGSEVYINITMDCSIANGTTIIGKVPEEYKPIEEMSNAVYLYSSDTKARVGSIKVDTDGNIIVGNWVGSAMTQVNGTIRYRYK